MGPLRCFRQPAGTGSMAERPAFVREEPGKGWLLQVRAVPGAKKSETAGLAENRLRVRLAAPAVENKANKALAAFIAERLGLRASQVRMVRGETARQKTLLVECPQEPDWTKLS